MNILRKHSARITEATSFILSFGNIKISPGRIYTKGQLYYAAWGEEYQYGMTTVENTIWRLRKKLEPDPKNPIYIKTVFRVGYKIDNQEE